MRSGEGHLLIVMLFGKEEGSRFVSAATMKGNRILFHTTSSSTRLGLRLCSAVVK